MAFTRFRRAICASGKRLWKKIFTISIQRTSPRPRCRSTPGNLRNVRGRRFIVLGRSERRKGNDLFVELVRWLDPSTFDVAAHIGDQDVSSAPGSAHRLADIAEARGIRVEHRPALDREGLLELFASSSILVLPVRYDSLNLIALDALFSGCPVAVSSKAGVCDYLDQTHPNLPYIKIDLDNFYASVPRIRDLVENYDSHRRLLHERLIQYPPLPLSRPDIGAVYEAILAGPPCGQNTQFSLPLVEYESPPKPGRAVDLKGAPRIAQCHEGPAAATAFTKNSGSIAQTL